jgi:hypothetical protein
MAKKGSVGGIGRIIFLVLGLALGVLTLVIWLNYLVNPARALVQGDKRNVTITRCEGSGVDRTCFGAWSGGSGKVDGHEPPGAHLSARIFGGKAYPMAIKDWYPRLVLAIVGLGTGILAQWLLRTGLRSKK